MSNYYFELGNGVKEPNLEAMLAKLLLDDILFCNDRKYLEEDNTSNGENTIVLFVNCNDVFGPVADAESLTMDDIPVLFELNDTKQGIIQWLCWKRNLQPWSKVKKHMKSIKAWNSFLEQLPPNPI